MNFKRKIGQLLEKIGLKQIGIKFDLKINSIYRDCIKHFRSIYIPLLVKYRSRKGVLAIDIDSDWLGLGARIVETIELLMYAEEKNLQLQLRYSYRRRYDCRNYFKDLIENKVIANQNKKFNKSFTKIRHIYELNLPKDYNKLLNVSLANHLFNKYLKINEDIMAEVNSFINYNFDGNILGLHYRGTDKVGEAVKINLEFIYELILKTLNNSEIKYSKLFISTDELNCINFFKIKTLPIEIIWHDDAYRSTDGNQFHRDPSSDISVINREALINCLLLSKCKLLIKTASILSDCCGILNPKLKMIILGIPRSQRLTWWPATELNAKYLYQQ